MSDCPLYGRSSTIFLGLILCCFDFIIHFLVKINSKSFSFLMIRSFEALLIVSLVLSFGTFFWWLTILRIDVLQFITMINDYTIYWSFMEQTWPFYSFLLFQWFLFFKLLRLFYNICRLLITKPLPRYKGIFLNKTKIIQYRIW